MPRRTPRAACVAAGLFALSALPAAAAPPSAPPPAAAMADLPDPTRTPPAQLWDDFLAHARSEDVRRGADLVGVLYASEGQDGGLDAGVCRAQAPALAEALRIAPVSLALWYARYRCAEATGDTAGADHALQAFHSLVKDAFDRLPPDNGDTPVRVATEGDIDAFLRASGLEIVYAYYDVFQADLDLRRMPLTMSLWDAQERRERRLSFDYFDTLLRLQKGKHAEFPLFARTLRDELLRAKAQDPQSAAASGMAAKTALQAPDPPARLRALKAAADQDHFAAVVALSSACLAVHKLDCASDAIDALLPWAERHAATALCMLALAYEQGLGVPKDLAAAKALVAAADQRLGGHRGTYFYAELTAVRHDANAPVSPVIAPVLGALAQAGEPTAEALIAILNLLAGRTLDAAQRAGLEHAAAAGVPRAQAMLGAALLQEGKTPAALPWLEKAANAESAIAQDSLGRLYAHGGDVPADPAKALAWSIRAGEHGDTDAMLRVARHWLAQPDSADARFHAQGWLQSATLAGNTAAARRLAALYATGAADLDGGRKEALTILRQLAPRPDQAASRRQLATMLSTDDGASAADSAEALRLLEGDAQHGDALSQFELGDHWLRGHFGKADTRTGLKWVRKAAEHDHDAALFLGNLIYYGRFGVRRDAAEGIARWRKLADANVPAARNNLAWALCTVSEPTLRDPAAGLRVANAMEAPGQPLPPAFLGTIAACHAATGDFAGALEHEQRALEAARQRQPPLPRFIAYSEARIADYGAGRVYVEPPGGMDE